MVSSKDLERLSIDELNKMAEDAKEKNKNILSFLIKEERKRRKIINKFKNNKSSKL